MPNVIKHQNFAMFYIKSLPMSTNVCHQKKSAERKYETLDFQGATAPPNYSICFTCSLGPNRHILSRTNRQTLHCVYMEYIQNHIDSNYVRMAYNPLGYLTVPGAL